MDIMGMMKKAREMQAKMEEMQAELEQTTVEGAAGGGVVRVQLSAKGDLKNLEIDDSLLKPEEKEILQDLIIAAHSDAQGGSSLRREDAGPHRGASAASRHEAAVLISWHAA
jgi:nucleoid-associated protein EbfC